MNCPSTCSAWPASKLPEASGISVLGASDREKAAECPAAKVAGLQSVEEHVTELARQTKISANDPRTWIYDLIVLLDSAVREIDNEGVENQVDSVKSALIIANSALRRHLNGDSAEVAPNQRDGLLVWQARKVREYIDGHISDTLSVADLAALINLSESHLSRSFRRTFGVPPHAFVMRRRLESAIQHMLGTEFPLSDIALRCGFVDQSHLCKLFRRAMGHTPAAWRRERLVQARERPHPTASEAGWSTMSDWHG